MGFSDLWSRTLVYFGIAEDEEWDDDALETNERQVEESYRRRDRQNVRRLPSTVEDDMDWPSEESAAQPRRERSQYTSVAAASLASASTIRLQAM